MGSDSGRLVILEYDVDKRKFVKVLQETMGKTGCTRAIPGQYVVCDPNGRAIMIGIFYDISYMWWSLPLFRRL